MVNDVPLIKLSGFWNAHRWQAATATSFVSFTALLVICVVSDHPSLIVTALLGMGMLISLIVMAWCYDRHTKENP